VQLHGDPYTKAAVQGNNHRRAVQYSTKITNFNPVCGVTVVTIMIYINVHSPNILVLYAYGLFILY